MNYNHTPENLEARSAFLEPFARSSTVKSLACTFAAVGRTAGWLTAIAAEPAFWSWAKTPPMGWNSWDCDGVGIWQSNFIANADSMAEHRKTHG